MVKILDDTARAALVVAANRPGVRSMWAKHRLATDDRRECGLGDLEGDLPFVPDIVSQIDGGHPALADLGGDGIWAEHGARLQGHGYEIR